LKINADTYVARSAIHGRGLFAASLIPRGTVIGHVEAVPSSRDGDYVLWLSADRGVEVTCDLKYINHADEPNACYYDDLSVVALRDIQPHEEITHNYASSEW
jgi:SET domain-containing protein